MKIEKVNDNQIRCTLTREDLLSRELKISELAYGTEKAKTLFRDMMRQANFEFGFEAEDIPLMIEAIPLNAECIVLIITKVEDPEELDTRFARFAPSVTEDDFDSADDAENDTEEVLDLFHKLQTCNQEEVSPDEKNSERASASPMIRIFRFSTLQDVMNACGLVAEHYEGTGTLYKDTRSELFFLYLTCPSTAKASFDRICNTLSEYGTLLRSLPAGNGYLEEHCDVLVRDTAVRSLGTA